VAILFLGMVLGIALAVSITGLAQWALPLGGNKGTTGGTSTATSQQEIPLGSADVASPEGASQQAGQHQPSGGHEQMHRMMDAMHGEGTSQLMHEAMGEDGEKVMDQCEAMMKEEMMEDMQAMMSGDGMMGR